MGLLSLLGLGKFEGYAIMAGAAAMLLLFCYLKGVHDEDKRWQTRWDAAEVKNEQAIVRARERALVVALQPYMKTITKIQQVFVDRVVEKEVPHDVLVQSNAQCRIPVWFVELWNSANQTRAIESAKGVDGADAKIQLDGVAAQHDRESAYAQTCEARLNGLQDYIEAHDAAVGN